MHVVKTVSSKEGITLCLLKVVPSNSDIFQWWVNLIISTTTLTNIRRNRVFQPNSKKLTTIHSPAPSGVLCKLLFYFGPYFMTYHAIIRVSYCCYVGWKKIIPLRIFHIKSWNKGRKNWNKVINKWKGKNNMSKDNRCCMASSLEKVCNDVDHWAKLKQRIEK